MLPLVLDACNNNTGECRGFTPFNVDEALNMIQIDTFVLIMNEFDLRICGGANVGKFATHCTDMACFITSIAST